MIDKIALFIGHFHPSMKMKIGNKMKVRVTQHLDSIK